LLKLEHAFEKNHYVVGAERKQLAQALSLTETQVSVGKLNANVPRWSRHTKVESNDLFNQISKFFNPMIALSNDRVSNKPIIMIITIIICHSRDMEIKYDILSDISSTSLTSY